MKNARYILILLTYGQVLKAQCEQPVFMNSGDNLQAIVDANPSSTLYILKEGTECNGWFPKKGYYHWRTRGRYEWFNDFR